MKACPDSFAGRGVDRWCIVNSTTLKNKLNGIGDIDQLFWFESLMHVCNMGPLCGPVQILDEQDQRGGEVVMFESAKQVGM